MGGFGAFGKMPALGDFLRLSLPPGFVDPWDAWVQAGLLAARAQLADRWQACFFSAPIWRFTLAPGLAGPVAVQGVLMPSVDRVGRQFPLTFVAALGGATNPDIVAAHLATESCFAVLEALALDALEDQMTRQMLSDRLLAITPTVARAMSGPGAGGCVVARCNGLMTDALAQELRAAAHARSSIWTAVWGGQTHAYLQSGMPPPARMADFYASDATLWHKTLTKGAPK